MKKLKPQIKIEYEHSDFGDIDVKDIPRIKLAAPDLVNSLIQSHTLHIMMKLTLLKWKNLEIH